MYKQFALDKSAVKINMFCIFRIFRCYSCWLSYLRNVLNIELECGSFMINTTTFKPRSHWIPICTYLYFKISKTLNHLLCEYNSLLFISWFLRNLSNSRANPRTCASFHIKRSNIHNRLSEFLYIKYWFAFLGKLNWVGSLFGTRNRERFEASSLGIRLWFGSSYRKNPRHTFLAVIFCLVSLSDVI